MAATAGGVAVGSAVGHVVGAGVSSMFSGGSSATPAPATAPPPPAPMAAAPPPAPVAQEPTGPCAFEIKQFIECSQQQYDITLCSTFNDALKECKSRNLIAQ